jgi:deoxyribonuclease V
MKNDFLEKALRISKNTDIDAAIELQKELRPFISLDDQYTSVNLVAGIDIAYTKDDCFCAIVVYDTRSGKVLEESFSKKQISFPYVPGLLFYREFPAFYDAYQKLKTNPDILMFDGQGLSHQRMMGIATMAGIILEKPAIGCAKSHLYSDNYQIPENIKMAQSELKIKNTLIGYVLRTKENIKPIFVSTGYRVSPASSLEIVKKLVGRYKLPLPTHLAHRACENFKKSNSL